MVDAHDAETHEKFASVVVVRELSRRRVDHELITSAMNYRPKKLNSSEVVEKKMPGSIALMQEKCYGP